MSDAYHTYHLTVDRRNGKVSGHAQTNDNFDEGWESEYAEWPVRYADLAEALRVTGGTHFGFFGAKVTVYVDGYRVDRAGNPVDALPDYEDVYDYYHEA